jgi:hypothetical protein
VLFFSFRESLYFFAQDISFSAFIVFPEIDGIQLLRYIFIASFSVFLT